MKKRNPLMADDCVCARVPCTRLICLLAALFLRLAAAAETLDLNTDAANCRVDLDGARITSLRIGGAEMLWNDNPPQKGAVDWAHGGMPLCWPRFGVDNVGRIHGDAWRRRFAIRRYASGSSRTELVLELSAGQAGLEYSIVLTDRLTLEMTTTNAGTNDFLCSYGLHPYLLVAERDSATVEGLDSLSFEDDPSRRDPKRGVWRGPFDIMASVDRIFSLQKAGRPACFTLVDRIGGRRVAVTCDGASHLNVWNPGVEKNCPGVVPGDEWRRFVCVEPIMAGGADGRPLPIPPGETRSLRLTVGSAKLEQD